MTVFPERTLGPAAVEYIRTRLKDGRSFAHALNDALNIEAGQAWTYLPADVRSDQAHDFKSGGKLPEPPESEWHRAPGVVMYPTPSMREFCVERLRELLGISDGVLIVEDWMAEGNSYTDGVPEECRRAIVVGNEVYWVLTAEDTMDAIEMAVRQAWGPWPGVLGAIVERPSGWTLSSDRRIDPHSWPRLAAATTHLIVGAYDAEGCVFWKSASR